MSANPSKALPGSFAFHTVGQDDAQLYALATCEGFYLSSKAREPATLGIVFSPSPHWSRFSFLIYTQAGELRMSHCGPAHSPGADAALVEGWFGFGVPAHTWSLVPAPSDVDFVDASHRAPYNEARVELCRALFAPRMRIWANQQFGVAPFFEPPESGFAVHNAQEETAENEEILRAVAEG